MLRYLKRWRRRRVLRDRPISESDWADTLAAVPLLRNLDAESLAQLRAMATWFVDEKDFYGAGGLSVTPFMQHVIAAQACLPVLELGYDWLNGWYSIYVYPGAFRTRRTRRNHIGLVERDDRVLSGEAQGAGGLVLSWDEVEEDIAVPDDGQNVVLHEIAHKLDMLNGDADGYPPLRRGMDRAAWARVMQAAFDQLNRQTRRGEPSIDPYGATDPAEFFAVISEYWFETPDTLRREFPEVAEQLRQFYGPLPRASAV